MTFQRRWCSSSDRLCVSIVMVPCHYSLNSSISSFPAITAIRNTTLCCNKTQNLFTMHCLIKRLCPVLVLSTLVLYSWKNDTTMVAEFNPLNNKKNTRKTFHDKDDVQFVASSLTTPSTTKQQQDINKTPNQIAYELATKWAHARFMKNTGGDGKQQKQQQHRLATDLKELWQWEKEDLNMTPTTKHSSTMRLLNLVRIPKAGSSALSVTARALAGCHPDGYPCCAGFPDNKACPAPDLLCKAVVGCTNHNPNYNVTMMNGRQRRRLPVLTSLRHPVSRAVSSFFYESPHRPRTLCFSWQCFHEAFLQKLQWQNPSTKMLVGFKAYAAVEPEQYPIQQAKERLCQTSTFFGIAEWPILSALLLYETYPFSQLQPNPVSFGLPANNKTQVDAAVQTAKARVLAKLNYSSSQIEAKTVAASASAAGLRQNQNDLYKQFKSGVFVENNGTNLVLRYHSHDWEVYQFAMNLFCARVRDAEIIDAVQNEDMMVATDVAVLMTHLEPCMPSIIQQPIVVPNAESVPGGHSEAAQLCTFA